VLPRAVWKRAFFVTPGRLNKPSGSQREHRPTAGDVPQLSGLSQLVSDATRSCEIGENLELFGRLFRLSRAEARRRASELLERFELTDAADRTTKTYSGGMRRRLDLASMGSHPARASDARADEREALLEHCLLPSLSVSEDDRTVDLLGSFVHDEHGGF